MTVFLIDARYTTRMTELRTEISLHSDLAHLGELGSALQNFP